MDQRSINEAVQQCVQRCLASDKLLSALSEFTNRLRQNGWPDSDIEIVKNAAARMLSAIYDMGGIEADEQAD